MSPKRPDRPAPHGHRSRRRIPGWLCLWLIVLALPRFAAAAVSIGLNFTGSTYGVDSPDQPPDSNGAVGPGHFVEFVNGRFSVYDKTTGQRVQTMTDLAFWTSGGVSFAAGVSVSDPRVVFDAASQRWFASMVDVSGSGRRLTANRFLVAVSAGSDPTGDWSAFAFAADPVNNYFADFSTLGVDANGVYLGGDLFNRRSNAVAPTLVALPKRDLLAEPPTIAHRTSLGLLNYLTYGEILQPAVTDGPGVTGGEAVLAIGDLGVDMQPHSTLASCVVNNAASAGQAKVSNGQSLAVPAYTVPINPQQPGGVDTLDNGDARISAMVRRVGDVLYAVHAVELNNRAAIQWFKVDAPTQMLLQSGTISDPALELYYPSIAANAAGTVVIGCNGSSSVSYISSYAFVGETTGGVLSFGAPLLLKAGAATFQNPDATGTSRWGDYSATTVDPADPTRFWTIQAYPSSGSAWSTQITELITREPALGITLSGTNLVISWPATAGYQLQSTPDLGQNPTWLPVAGTPVLRSGNSTVVLPIAAGSAFFRLAKP